MKGARNERRSVDGLRRGAVVRQRGWREFGFVTEKMPEGAYDAKAESFRGQIAAMIRVEE